MDNGPVESRIEWLSYTRVSWWRLRPPSSRDIDLINKEVEQ